MLDASIIGVAMRLPEVAAHRDWLFSAPRNLELQDFHQADILSGDWSGLIDLAKGETDGLPRRFAVYDPF